MKIIISPAKTINETSPLPTARHSLAIFSEEIAEVHKALKPLSPQKLSVLMSISAKLAELNWQRNQAFEMPLSPEKARPMTVMYMRDWMLIRFLKCKLTSYKGVCGFSLGSMAC